MVRPQVTPAWFVDETSLGLARALATARRDVVHPGHPRLPEVPRDTDDIDWMPVVAARGLVVISRDRHIRTKPAELAALREHGLRAFWIAGKRDMSNWQNLVLLVKWWERLEDIVRDRPTGPWFYAISDGAIREIYVLSA